MSLVVRDLTVVDDGRTLLPPVDLDVAPGSLTLVLSRSGAGEGVLVPAVAGLRRRSGGTVLLDGREVTPRDVALVPRDHGLPTTLTALETVVVALLGRGVPPADAHERALRRLADVGLDESASHLTEELSGGQRQRVAVARALATDAPVLLADEPTSALDAANVVRVMTLLQERARAGCAVLVTSNDEAAAEHADRVVEL